ncbi:MAG: thioesterase [Clostridia bacterium]
MTTYWLEHTVDVGEINFLKQIKLSALLNLFQLAAAANSKQLGQGVVLLSTLDCGWVLSRVRMQLQRLPMLDENIKIETWAISPKNIEYEREFRIYNENGEILLCASTRWCIMNIKQKRILRTSEAPYISIPLRNDRAIITPLSRLKYIGEWQNCYNLPIRLSSVDLNKHMNNTKYADCIIDSFSLSQLSNLNIKVFQLDYIGQVYFGDTLSIFRSNDGDYFKGEVNGEMKFLAQCLTT